MAERVANVHGGHTPTLVEVYQVFAAMKDEFTSHITKEEQILFPAIVTLTRGGENTLPVDGPIAPRLNDHVDVGAALSRLSSAAESSLPTR